MSPLPETTDVTVLDLLRKSGGMRVSELSQAMSVTATAVRQRLTRLMAQGWSDDRRSGRVAADPVIRMN